MKKIFSLMLVGLLMFSLIGTFVLAEDEFNSEQELVCCYSYGYGSQMVKVNEKYEFVPKEDCSVPGAPYAGGNKEIVENSLCNSTELVCCYSYGYGSQMVKVNEKYEFVPKEDCSVPGAPYAGGNKEIVENSLCNSINVSNDELLNNSVSLESNVSLGSINKLVISPEPISENSSTNVFWDGFRRAFTFNKEKKAKYSLIIAEKRMLRAGEFSAEGKYEQAQLMVDKHKAAMEKAEAYFDEVETNGDINESKWAIAKTIFMQNRIEANKERALNIKARILENHADNMTEEQLAHLEDVFSRIEDRANKSEAKVEQKQANLKLRYKAVSGFTDEEIETSLKDYNGFIKQKRVKRNANVQAKKMKIEQQKENIQAKQRKIEQQKENIQARDGTGEFHDENFEQGKSGSGNQK